MPLRPSSSFEYEAGYPLAGFHMRLSCSSPRQSLSSSSRTFYIAMGESLRYIYSIPLRQFHQNSGLQSREFPLF